MVSLRQTASRGLLPTYHEPGLLADSRRRPSAARWASAVVRPWMVGVAALLALLPIAFMLLQSWPAEQAPVWRVDHRSALPEKPERDAWSPPPPPPELVTSQTAAAPMEAALRPWGIAAVDAPRYRPTEHGKFLCADAEGTVRAIPFASVNDDFCDCADQSDEPGTAACPGGRFACLSDGRAVPSNRVHDGVHDCADGSDEWIVDALGRPL